MSMPGLGVMIAALSGDRGDVNLIKNAIGKHIGSVQIVDNVLRFEMRDGPSFALRDDGQSCCESRYMSTDDDLTKFAGDKLIDVEIADGQARDTEYGNVTEVQFLKVQTSGGNFTVANYNEHNGYYGGFWIKAEELDPCAT